MGLNVIKLIAGLGGVFGMGPDVRAWVSKRKNSELDIWWPLIAL